MAGTGKSQQEGRPGLEQVAVAIVLACKMGDFKSSFKSQPSCIGLA